MSFKGIIFVPRCWIDLDKSSGNAFTLVGVLISLSHTSAALVYLCYNVGR
jgi:hypothetical protein